MSKANTHVLYESASGYAIFDVKLAEDVGLKTQAMQESIADLGKFGKMVSLKSFVPFKSAAQALENANDISEGIVNEHLKNVLEMNFGKPTKKNPILLAVSDKNLAGAIRDATGIPCQVSEQGDDLLRGIRLHASKLLKGLQQDDLTKAQLGLGHSYSRAKLKFNVNRIDNMIIQAIALLDQLDKDVNLFSMRVREWYGYHFPELVRIVPDNYNYARAAQFIKNKEELTEESLPELAEILDNDSTAAQNVLDAARGSMGAALSPIDMLNVTMLATRVVSLTDYRKSLISYLSEKMNQVAPSLTALLGERIGARLISHAGSLTNLSKYPASTVQILGAEKALFRALKTKGNTPKYGLIYHSSFIGRAGPKHKGRISRFLANKCSIASRIDCYTDNPTPKFGEALRNQVEERLNFFATGEPPTKNAEALRKVLAEVGMDIDEDDEDDKENGDMDVDGPALTTLEATPSKKESKKKNKRKADAMDVDEDEEPAEKKVKLSKEEKKALKKEKKKAAKEASAGGEDAKADKKEKKAKKEKKEKKKKEA